MNMQRRGPRGDITKAGILLAANNLLVARGQVSEVSLRAVATEVGVATNAIYTYFPSLQAIWHDLADQRLGLLNPRQLLDYDCRHCALLELAHRAAAMARVPGTVALLHTQPVLGEHSFTLSETIMELTESGLVDPRDAHDLIVGWFYGSTMLVSEGWTAGTDEIRGSSTLEQFPRIASRSDADQDAQFEAILRGIGILHAVHDG
ncbi:TetR/AcrR family transcriptional regulator [Glutamicibacter sp. MNS18]|uniref:TetR/AcrR family transcriptional regulator n=1 Tax=Glutamicibacter sp. MNS18 TaxID=2989817 RepID=UPI0022358EEF|nr:TetR/AcrR family transcriptional regulator [Glutamicibacter sp. MNS18]MCW4465512.1 TetR/AcrR family transcriptional regulator [Glutamicibacter sp. MNS18]